MDASWEEDRICIRDIYRRVSPYESHSRRGNFILRLEINLSLICPYSMIVIMTVD